MHTTLISREELRGQQKLALHSKQSHSTNGILFLNQLLENWIIFHSNPDIIPRYAMHLKNTGVSHTLKEQWRKEKSFKPPLYLL